MTNVAILASGSYGKYSYVISRDYAAGRPNRYTLYRIPSSEGQRVKIIGRELTLEHCKRIICECVAKLKQGEGG